MHTETKQYTYNMHPKKKTKQLNKQKTTAKQAKQKQSSLLHSSTDGQCNALLNSNRQSGKIAIGHVSMSKGSYL